MKVLHINNVANVPDGLVKGLRKIGVDAELYQPYVGINKKRRLGPISVIANRFVDAKSLTKKIKKERYDIVHIHYAYFGMLGILGGYDYWLHCHGTDIRRNQYHPLYKHITSPSMKRANTLLYSTPDLKIHAERKRKDAIFLPNPIQTSLFEPTPLPKQDNRKILLISRIDAIKGVDSAFKALESIKKNNPSVSIDAFLWGPELDKYKDQNFVNWIPTMKHEEISKLIQNYHIVVGQFHLGILGMSEMEAMACARPVVCDFTYGSWYPQEPPVVQAKTVEEIAGRIQELLDDPSMCEDIGEAGRNWVMNNHDYIAVAKRLAEMYEKKPV